MLAFLRGDAPRPVLVVANLGASAQPVELDLAEYDGHEPVEMTARHALPARSASCPTCSTLGPHGFYWFGLQEPADGSRRR